MKLDHDLYVYLWEDPYENNCNSYVVTGEKTLLIDPGHLRHVDRLFGLIARDGLDPDQIGLVIATHSHPDHFEGLEAFRNKRVKIAMARDEERYLSESGRLLFEMMQQPLPEFRIDFYLGEGQLQVGEKVFDVLLTPGHSPGSLSIYWPERQALFTGDVIFYGGIGRTDFTEGDPGLLGESIQRLTRLDAEWILPGHGEIVRSREAVLQNFQFIRESFYPYL
jgi:glyoxylase-like metal-dependent hydrolase (beta-lactamase superfamily II)